ncbi:hypothetical protein SAMN05192533_101514 [Mesobacillus persicus]|uniref:Uncharacterized protein n=1 Tax=Mesobacillus persicus TaxID=930146 RepID=A0A1H7WN09_9BACI|nr:hypothetical protein [Mesobacillus persicus]SEM22903.1 hypothetical protein SAMN05192533_101514 [Mesobacillus persicus]
MANETWDIQTKFTRTLIQKAENHFFSYMDHIAQNVAYLCLSAEEEGIPLKMRNDQTLSEFISDHSEEATGEFRMILQMSESVEDFFYEATHSWLVREVQDVLTELIYSDRQPLERWLNEKSELVEGNLLESFEKDSLLVTFELLDHEEIHHIVHKEITEQLLKEVYPMNFMFLYKKGEKLYRRKNR